MKLRYVFSFVVVLSQVFFMQAGDLQPKHKTVGELVENYLNKKRLLDQGMNDQESISSKTARTFQTSVSSLSVSSSQKNKIAQDDHLMQTHVKQALAGVDKESESIHLKLTPKEVAKQAYQNAIVAGLSKEEVKKIYNKAYKKEYDQSDEGREASQKYNQSEKGKERAKKHAQKVKEKQFEESLVGNQNDTSVISKQANKHKTVGELVENYLRQLNQKRSSDQNMNDQESSALRNQINPIQDKQVLVEAVGNIVEIDKDYESQHSKFRPAQVANQVYENLLSEGLSKEEAKKEPDKAYRREFYDQNKVYILARQKIYDCKNRKKVKFFEESRAENKQNDTSDENCSQNNVSNYNVSYNKKNEKKDEDKFWDEACKLLE